MKTPWKYPSLKSWLPTSIVGGLIVTAFLFFLVQPVGYIAFLQIAIVFLLTIFLNWIIMFGARTYFTRKVTHPADPDTLQGGSVIYWLNGEFPAQYIGKHAYTGKLLFKIGGLYDPKYPNQYERLLPGQVREYISLTKEVFSS